VNSARGGSWRKVLALAALGVCCTLACSRENQSALIDGLKLYRQNKLEQAIPLLERAAEQRPEDPGAQAWLAETYRRLGKPDKAAEAARRALDIDPCNTFAHAVLALDCNPMYGLWPGVNFEVSWRHLMKAVECDSSDGNVWIAIWPEAIHRGDREQCRRAIRRLVETGFLTEPLLSYNRWVLGNLPQDALLITNGDWDTYPAVALQEVEGLRRDVAVANRELLNLPWYAAYIRDHYGVELPFAAEELPGLRPIEEEGRVISVAGRIVRGWTEKAAEGTFTRPIAVAVTVGPEQLLPGLEEDLVLAGPYWLYSASPPEVSIDTTLVAKSLSGLTADFLEGSFVSANDRSPVRITTGALLVNNVSAAALKYAEALIAAGRGEDAARTLDWIEEFEENTELGPRSGPRIEELRRSIRAERRS